jgi:hypothetical protein
MKKGHFVLGLLIVVFLLTSVPSIEAGPGGLVASADAGFHRSANNNNMLQLKAGGHLLGFQPKRVYFASLDHALSVEFLGTLGVMPKTAAGGKETGKESKVSSLGRVVYEELWEGISLTYEAREGGIAESTYQIGPWADVSKIRLRYNVPVEVQRDGSLKFKFDTGFLTESSPEAWQEIGGKRVPVAVALRVKGGEVGFSVGKYDPSYPLTIDPTYSWHTFYGSSSDDTGMGFAVDASGDVYITGVSGAWNGPSGQSPLHAHSGGSDIFVLKLNSSGAYQWHTFYGSSSNEGGYGIATYGIWVSGYIYVTGSSDGTWNGPAGQLPLHARSGSYRDIFVLKLNSSGVYQWHTFYGSNADGGRGILTDSSGYVYIAGGSNATWNGPAGQSPLHAHSGLNEDVFVLKLNSSGAYQWHTFYGSSVNDYCSGIATLGSAYIYVTGSSDGTWNGPTGQAPLHGFSGSGDIYVLKLDTKGSYQWHTFYGSSDSDDHGEGIAIDASGNVYVSGYSGPWNGPAGQGPLHAYSGGLNDIFALKLSSSGTYQWHTFYGSSDPDSGYGVAVDGRGNVYVTGHSLSTWNGPAGQSPLHAHSGSYDIFTLKVLSSGIYQWHTFYGASYADYDEGITTDGRGYIYILGGSVTTWNGPAGQLPLHAHTGGDLNFDFFVLKLSDAPISCDFDGDGNTDIPWRHKTSGQNAVWLMNGTAWSSTVSLPTVADTNWEMVGAGDLNNDDQTDILWRHKTDGRNAVWLMNGTAWSSTVSLPGVADTNWEMVGAGDFNGDGNPDMLWRHKTDGRNSVWLMNGTTWSSTVSLPGVADTNWEMIGAGDFNNDDQTDILWRHKTDGRNAVWLMNGTTWSSTVSLPAVADTNWEMVGAGDFNGDRETDILWRHKTTGQNAVWLMNGTTWGSTVSLPAVADTNWEIVGP